MTGKRIAKITGITLSEVIVLFVVISFVACKVLYSQMFGRVEERDYDCSVAFSLDDLGDMPKRAIEFESEGNTLRGYVFGEKSEKGLVVIAHGIGGVMNDYFPEMIYLVENGYQVMMYNCTGTATSDGDGTKSLSQSALDLHHPLFMSGTPDVVQQSYDAAIARLQNADEITVNTLRREVQSIMSVLGDGHTTAWGYWYEHYLKTVPKRNAEGWHLVEINGRTLESIFDEKKSLFSYEVKSWGMEQLSSEVCVLSGLDFLGLDPNGITYTWQNDEGERETDRYTASDFITYDKYLEYNKAYLDDEDEDFVSYRIDEEKSLALLTLTSCNYNEQYINCLKDMFTKVKAKGIRNVAVDIRGNGGGSSSVANEFIRYLDIDQYLEGTCKWRFGVFKVSLGDGIVINEKYSDLTFEGDVFLLTDTSSFSSSMLFAQYVKDNNLGSIIGEPPGNTPNGYGDISTFSMPNSGLCFQVSTKQFFRADKDSKDILVMPDIECDGEKALDVLYETLDK